MTKAARKNRSGCLGHSGATSHLPSTFETLGLCDSLPIEKNHPTYQCRNGQNLDSTCKIPDIQGLLLDKSCQNREVCLALASAFHLPLKHHFPMLSLLWKRTDIFLQMCMSKIGILCIQGEHPDKICQYHLIWLSLASGDCPSSAPATLGSVVSFLWRPL